MSFDDSLRCPPAFLPVLSGFLACYETIFFMLYLTLCFHVAFFDTFRSCLICRNPTHLLPFARPNSMLFLYAFGNIVDFFVLFFVVACIQMLRRSTMTSTGECSHFKMLFYSYTTLLPYLFQISLVNLIHKLPFLNI